MRALRMRIYGYWRKSKILHKLSERCVSGKTKNIWAVVLFEAQSAIDKLNKNLHIVRKKYYE